MAIILDSLRVSNAFYLVVDSDPATGGGTKAGINSLALDPSGITYQKNGLLDTDWVVVASPGGSGADTFLSNLTAPTDINEDLIMRGTSQGFFQPNLAKIKTSDTGPFGTPRLNITTGDGAGVASGILFLSAGSSDTTPGNTILTAGNGNGTNTNGGNLVISGGGPSGTGNAGNVTISDAGAIDGAGGNVILATSPPGGIGTRGVIQFQDGSESGGAGYVWTLQDTSGTGQWAAVGGNSLRVITGSDTLSASTDYKAVVEAGAGTFTLTLPVGTQNLSFIIGQSDTNVGVFTILTSGGNILDVNIQTIFDNNQPVSVTYNTATNKWYAI